MTKSKSGDILRNALVGGVFAMIGVATQTIWEKAWIFWAVVLIAINLILVTRWLYLLYRK